MGNNYTNCCCKDKEPESESKSIQHSSRRSSRRGMYKEKHHQSSYQVYDGNRHTTNIITTNAAVIYNDDKAKQLVKDIMNQKESKPDNKRMEARNDNEVLRVIQNEPEVPLNMSKDEKPVMKINFCKDAQQSDKKYPDNESNDRLKSTVFTLLCILYALHTEDDLWFLILLYKYSVVIKLVLLTVSYSNNRCWLKEIFSRWIKLEARG